MTTIYIAEVVGDTEAAPTEAAAKKLAKDAHDIDGGTYRVMKVELAKLGTRELLCALFNNETDKFVGTKEHVYTAPAPRGRKAKTEEAPATPVGADVPAEAEEDFSDI